MQTHYSETLKRRVTVPDAPDLKEDELYFGPGGGLFCGRHVNQPAREANLRDLAEYQQAGLKMACERCGELGRFER